MSESGVLSSRGNSLRHATVADAVHPGILSCDADATLAEVARVMSSEHVHYVAVGGTGEGPGLDSRVWTTRQPVGILSTLDVAGVLAREAPSRGDR